MAHSHTTPTIKELRLFGVVFAMFLLFVTKVILGLGFDVQSGNWPYYVSAGLVLLAFPIPKAIILLHVPWMKFANIIHWLNTHLIMGITFYLLITPIGVIMRLFGKNPMRCNASKESYRVAGNNRESTHIQRPY